MFKKMIFVLVVLTAFSFASSAEATTGCRRYIFFGTYTRPDLNNNVFGDGSVTHSWTFQLTLHIDGTANQYWTGFNDFPMNTGTQSPWIGSWKCRDDGKLVVTMIGAQYTPAAAGSNPNLAVADVTLVNHIRSTYLFSVDNSNTLTRLQTRTRFYGPNDDPTDPTGGVLGNLVTTNAVYTRLSASDADLNLP